MPVMCEVLNIFVKLEPLERALAGIRREGSMAELFPAFWHDGEIARLGAMNEFDIHVLIGELEKLGLRRTRDFGDLDVAWIDRQAEGAPSGFAALKGGRSRIAVGPHNFDDFLEGKLRKMRLRATALVFRAGRVLLVRDKGQRKYSLPGGGLNRNEPALAAAVRELCEETGLKAVSARRFPSCDLDGRANRHLVSLLEVVEYVELEVGAELDDAIWWNMSDPISCFPHVTEILERWRANSSVVPHDDGARTISGAALAVLSR